MLFATPATASAPDLLNTKRQSVLQQDGLWKACTLTCCPDALRLHTNPAQVQVVLAWSQVRCANGTEPAEASAWNLRRLAPKPILCKMVTRSIFFAYTLIGCVNVLPIST